MDPNREEPEERQGQRQGQGQAPSGTPGSRQSTPWQGEAGLRELALRLAATRSLGAPWSNPTAEPELFVGAIPASFPFALPQPDGSRVVGSVQVGSATTIYLDASQSPAQVLAFYRDQLPAEGWKALDWPPGRHGGFVATMGAMANRLTFCRGEDAPALTVSAFELAGAPAGSAGSVQVELNTFAESPEYSPCAQQRRMRGPMGPQMEDIFPALVPPVGAQQRPQGGGGGGDTWHTSADLKSDLTLAEVRSHYERQLLDAGWTRAASGESGPVAWSTWAFRDKDGQEWRALFFILHEPEAQDAYYLFLQARSANPRGSRAGGFSSFSLSRLSSGQTIVSGLESKLGVKGGATGEGQAEHGQESGKDQDKDQGKEQGGERDTEQR